MKLPEAVHLLRVKRPPAPYGARMLARCYSIDDVARDARLRLPLGARAYLDTGGEGEYTLHRNRPALDVIELLPEQPRQVTSIDTSTTVLGRQIPLPIVLSPIGAPRLFHHEGERAVTRSAEHTGVPYGVSTLATVSRGKDRRSGLLPTMVPAVCVGRPPRREEGSGTGPSSRL